MRIANILLAALLAGPGAALAGGVVEDWAGLDSGNIGSYADDQGSSLNFQVVKGPKDVQVLELDFELKQGGYCGIWHTLGKDLSQAGKFRFLAKATTPGECQMDLQDKYNVSYTANFQIPSTDWTEVVVPLSAFQKNPYYQPPDAQQGNPMDLSETKNLNFGPHIAGKAKVWIGPVSWEEGSGAPARPAGGAPKAEAPKGTGAKLTVQDFTKDESGISGTYADDQGSKIEFAYQVNPKNKSDKMLVIKYDLKQGGYCGLWHRAGDTWDAQDWSGGVALELGVYTKAPVQIGMAFQDANSVQYTSNGATTKGGKWEILRIPLDSFQKDPYYQPPEAKKDAPQDLSAVKTFNLVPRTPGAGSIAIDWIKLVK